MPAAGRKPVEGPKRNRNPLTFEWTEVPDVDYDGVRPELPETRGRLRKVPGMADAFDEVPLQDLTREWWAAVSRMPHCALWTAADWVFAIETAIVADRFYAGEPAAAGELRQREKILGTTLDARRDLRIRYVAPEVEEKPVARRKSGTVTRLDERRRRLADGAS